MFLDLSFKLRQFDVDSRINVGLVANKRMEVLIVPSDNITNREC